MDKPIKTIVQERMKKLEIGIPQLAIATGIPQARIYKWYNKKRPANPKETDCDTLKEWLEKSSNSSSREAPQKGEQYHTEPTPMQLMKIIVETNESIRKDHSDLISLHKQIVETNAKLADTNSELAKKIPEPIASETQQNVPIVEAKLDEALALLFEIGTGKRWHSKTELEATWNKRIAVALGLIGETGTQNSSGKKSRVTT